MNEYPEPLEKYFDDEYIKELYINELELEYKELEFKLEKAKEKVKYEKKKIEEIKLKNQPKYTINFSVKQNYEWSVDYYKKIEGSKTDCIKGFYKFLDKFNNIDDHLIYKYQTYITDLYSGNNSDNYINIEFIEVKSSNNKKFRIVIKKTYIEDLDEFSGSSTTETKSFYTNKGVNFSINTEKYKFDEL